MNPSPELLFGNNTPRLAGWSFGNLPYLIAFGNHYFPADEVQTNRTQKI
jgi:hypothetical protein